MHSTAAPIVNMSLVLPSCLPPFPKSLILSVTAIALATSFTSAQIVDITQNNVSLPDGVDAGRAIPGDMDGDGDIDFVINDFTGAAGAYFHRIAWARNDGTENWEVLPISGNEQGLETFDVGDMDGDGDLDVITGSYGHISVGPTIPTFPIFPWNPFFPFPGIGVPQGGDGAGIRVYSNDGQGSFTSNTIVGSAGAKYTRTVAVADLDRDRDLDIVFVQDRTVNRIAWIPNNGNGTYDSVRVVTQEDDLFPRTFDIGDLDEDGYVDIVAKAYPGSSLVVGAADGGQIISLKNPGGRAGPWEKIVVPESDLLLMQRNLYLADVNQDSFLDVVGISEWGNGNYGYHPGDGTGNFGPLIGAGSELYWEGLHVVDFDGDGDLDQFRTSPTGNALIYESWEGGAAAQTQTFSAPRLAEPQSDGSGIFTADVNGDGRLDIVTFGAEITWYEVTVSNPGGGGNGNGGGGNNGGGEVIDNAGSTSEDAISLGVLGDGQAQINFDTLQSSIDTEIALFYPDGRLAAENDDFNQTLQSGFGFSSMSPGTWYIAVGQYDTTFADGFSATGGPPGGTIALTVNANENTRARIQQTGAVWFSFDIRPNPLGLPPERAVALGALGDGSLPLQFSTLGSTLDTQMALYGPEGNLLIENDDFNGTRQSGFSASDLTQGIYHVAVSLYQTIFRDGFSVQAPPQAGPFVLRYGTNQSIQGALPADGVRWFSFEVTPRSAPQVDLSGLWISDGNINMSWETQAGVNYRVQRSTDLETWQNIGRFRVGTGNTLQHSLLISGEKQFFRVVIP